MRDPEFQDNPDTYRHSGAQKPRKPQLNIWQKMSRVMEIIIYVLLILVFAKLISPELQKQEKLQSELEALETVRSEKQAEVEKLRREHTNLISDRQYMEAVARDRLNLQREGEYIIQIER